MLIVEQGGFRPFQETVMQALALSLLVERRLQHGLLTYAFLIDVKKAYDSVPHEALFKKMELLGIRGRFISIIRSLYHHSTLQMIAPTGVVFSAVNNCGLRQGCPLSPVLFNIYINDILEDSGFNLGVQVPGLHTCGGQQCTLTVKDNTSGPNRHAPLQSNLVRGLLFADDCVMFASSYDQLKLQVIPHVKHWFKENKLDLNTSKCDIIRFTPTKSLCKPAFHAAQLLRSDASHIHRNHHERVLNTISAKSILLSPQEQASRQLALQLHDIICIDMNSQSFEPLHATNDTIKCFLTVNGHNEYIPIRDEVRYLGYWIDSSLSPSTHISKVVTRKERLIRFAQVRLCHRHFPLFYRRIYIIQCTISPVTYACAIWGPRANISELHKLDTVTQACARAALRVKKTSPSDCVLDELGLRTLQGYITRDVTRCLRKYANSKKCYTYIGAILVHPTNWNITNTTNYSLSNQLTRKSYGFGNGLWTQSVLLMLFRARNVEKALRQQNPLWPQWEQSIDIIREAMRVNYNHDIESSADNIRQDLLETTTTTPTSQQVIRHIRLEECNEILQIIYSRLLNPSATMLRWRRPMRFGFGGIITFSRFLTDIIDGFTYLCQIRSGSYSTSAFRLYPGYAGPYSIDDHGSYLRPFTCPLCFKQLIANSTLGMQWEIAHRLLFCTHHSCISARDEFLMPVIRMIHPSTLDRLQHVENDALDLSAFYAHLPPILPGWKHYSGHAGFNRKLGQAAMNKLKKQAIAVEVLLNSYKYGTSIPIQYDITLNDLWLNGNVQQQNWNNAKPSSLSDRRFRIYSSPLSFLLGGCPLNPIEETALRNDPQQLLTMNPVCIDTAILNVKPLQYPRYWDLPDTCRTRDMISYYGKESILDPTLIQLQEAKGVIIQLTTVACTSAFLQVTTPLWKRGFENMKSNSRGDIRDIIDSNHADSVERFAVDDGDHVEISLTTTNNSGDMELLQQLDAITRDAPSDVLVDRLDEDLVDYAWYNDCLPQLVDEPNINC